MRFSILKANGRNLTRGCAILVLAGVASGCSSQVARFNGVDDVFTASTPNQQQIINNQRPAAQAYPGDSVAAAPMDGSYTQPVGRSSLEPVTQRPLPPVAQAAPVMAAPKPIRTASAPLVDSTATGTIASPKPFKAAQPDAMANATSTQPAKQNRGTEIIVAEGQTLGGLSRRYNVPADAIAKVNGLDASKGLRTGQKLTIPAYAYSIKGADTAKIADAKPVNKDAPVNAPAEKVAVLPQQPKVKEGKAVAQVDTTAGVPKAKETKVAEAKVSGAGSYTVQSGDTLSKISRKTGASTASLKQANGLQDGVLKIGQTLKVPAAGETVVASAKPAEAKADPIVTSSTGSSTKGAKAEPTLTAYTPPKKDLVIQQAEDDDAVAPNATGVGKMRWPVRGRVISGFGGGKDGDGIDIAVPEGTPIKAAENGVVIYAGNGLKEFGNTVLVRHENGLVTVYGHASNLEVQRGQKVKRGQEIAQSGMSGTTDSPKLHFEVRKNSAPVDPSTYLD